MLLESNAELCTYNLPGFRPLKRPETWQIISTLSYSSTTTHTIPAIQTLITSAAAYGNMTTDVTRWRVTLHIDSRRIHSIQSGGLFCVMVPGT